VIVPTQSLRIVLAVRPVDFRCGPDALAGLVQNTLGLDPHSGLIVVFRSKRMDRLKQSPLRADRIEKLQHRGARQSLRCDRRASASLECAENAGSSSASAALVTRRIAPQRMLRRHPRVKVDKGEPRAISSDPQIRADQRTGASAKPLASLPILDGTPHHTWSGSRAGHAPSASGRNSDAGLCGFGQARRHVPGE